MALLGSLPLRADASATSVGLDLASPVVAGFTSSGDAVVQGWELDRTGLYLVSPESGEVVLEIEGPDTPFSRVRAQVSADGEVLAYLGPVPGGIANEIVVMRTDGQALLRLGPGILRLFGMTPDGTRVLYWDGGALMSASVLDGSVVEMAAADDVRLGRLSGPPDAPRYVPSAGLITADSRRVLFMGTDRRVYSRLVDASEPAIALTGPLDDDRAQLRGFADDFAIISEGLPGSPTDPALPVWAAPVDGSRPASHLGSAAHVSVAHGENPLVVLVERTGDDWTVVTSAPDGSARREFSMGPAGHPNDDGVKLLPVLHMPERASGGVLYQVLDGNRAELFWQSLSPGAAPVGLTVDDGGLPCWSDPEQYRYATCGTRATVDGETGIAVVQAGFDDLTRSYAARLDGTSALVDLGIAEALWVGQGLVLGRWVRDTHLVGGSRRGDAVLVDAGGENDPAAAAVGIDVDRAVVSPSGEHLIVQGRHGLVVVDLDEWTFPQRLPAAPDRTGDVAAGDFDGDGDDEFVVGSPGEDVDGHPNVGVVDVFETARAGGHGLRLEARSETLGWSSHGGESFGAALAVGDFDADGFDDLAVAAPGRHLGRGSVTIVFGSAVGLDGGRHPITVTEDSPGVPGLGRADDDFGAALASGDVDGDGHADLIIGAPRDDEPRLVEDEGPTGLQLGATFVIYGSPDGVALDRSERFRPTTRQELHSGFSVAAGDIDGDGYDDVVSGSPAYQGSPFPGSGRVVAGGGVLIRYGSADGLTQHEQLITQRNPGIRGTSESLDWFGWSVAVGDIDRDGFGDVIAGVPGEDTPDGNDVGAVAVLYGTAAGVGTRDQLITQATPGVKGTSEPGDRFGSTVLASDIDRDGYADLIIGAPREDVGDIVDAGAIWVIYGTPNGVGTRDQRYHQNKRGIKGRADPGDGFGEHLAAGNLPGRGHHLLVGSPSADRGGAIDAGEVNVFRIAGDRLTKKGDRLLHQNTNPETAPAATGDRFG